jgi:Protein of unknown function (DUF3060)
VIYRGVFAWAGLMGLALVPGGSTAAAAAPEDLVIQGVDVERSITCDEREVMIRGTSHRLTLRGSCQKVTIFGTGHVVHVEGLGTAWLAGIDNRLEWERALRGERPDITVTGNGNRAVHAEGAVHVEGAAGSVRLSGEGGASVTVDGRTGTVRLGTGAGAPASLTISDTELEKSFDCGGGSALVEGSDNRLTLNGCAELTVTGGENHIVLVGPVRRIRLLGGDNSVEWSEGEGGRSPRVETPGSGNRVTRNQK